jgi:ubiquinone biosynthesis protein
MIIKRKEQFLFWRPLAPQELKETILTLGTSFIKLAQVLATRSDFFSPEYLEELAKLHDQTPAMKAKELDALLHRYNLEKHFTHFERAPIASASIGQVHVAYLENGQKVAVKLLRHGVKEQVLADIKIIKFYNKLFKPLFSHYTKHSIEAVVSEFSKMIVQEINFTQELHNLKKFSDMYKESGVLFPKPYELYCSNEVLVMSFEEGFRFDDKDSLEKYELDFNPIIQKLVNFYMQQMLLEGFFHADPHPGNLLITKEGELVLLDFGMVKMVPNDTRIAIIELIKAANEQDFERYIAANKRLGTLTYDAPKADMVEFTSKMFAIFSDENLSNETMQDLAFEVLESMRNIPFKFPSDAIYILRVSAIIEGLGTTYIKNFNGIKDILPILQQNIPAALGMKDTLIENVISEMSDIPKLVNNVKSVLHKADANELQITLNPMQLESVALKLREEVKFYLLHTLSLSFGFTLFFVLGQYHEIALLMLLYSSFRVITR